MEELKTRSKEQIDQEYSNHAIQLGHKTRIVQQLQIEMKGHLDALMALNQEGMELQKKAQEEKASA